MATLFNGDNSDSDGELKINKDYANIYNNFREKEELHKLKARYGDDAVNLKDESDTSSSDDDDDEIIQDPQFEKEFLMTLACLKNEDPCIYDKKTKFFSDVTKPGTSKDDVESEKKEKKSKKEKSLFLRDYERKIMMERNGRYSSSEDEDDTEQKAKSVTITYTEEQKQIKDSFKHALKDDDDGEDIDFLKIKEKTDEEKHKEDESYKEWLKGREVKIDSQDQEILKPLRDFWNDPNLDTNEKFLRDYILNNKYMDSASYDADLDYNHVVHDSDENLSEDEKTIQKQEEFERKYNFRFEEPDQEFIKRYPRTMENSMRKKDTRRAQKRIEVKQRKEEEKQRKNEELKQLKALKRKEIEEKIEKLKEITGNNDMHFDNVDFDADFDPNEHDKKMKELFSDEYYADYAADEDKKPEFPDVDEELDIERTWDQYDPSANKIDRKEEPHCEDPDFNMDADYDESQNFQADLENTNKKKRRRRSKFAELLTKEKPKFDPKQYPSYEEYFDQYYSLDYEDMIGDLPCRFKYRKVVPNDYGLTVDEILTADDRELNKWCSLRQALKHKPEHVEQQELRMYKQKGKNEALKRKVLRSLYVDPEEEKQEKSESIDEQAAGKKHRRKKKSKTHSYNAESTMATDIIPKEENINITESDMQNNSCDSKNDKKQGEDKDLEGKIVINKSKRKNKLKTDDEGSVPKKIKINDAENEDSQSNDIKIKIEKDVEVEKNKKKVSDTKIKNKNKMPSAENCTISKKKKKDLKLNKGRKVGKHKQGDVDSMMSLDAERLKMYGINAKKFKNKLKYGNKKF